ncbi:low molecular weight phosphatase family protein [Citricoccus sp. SGAir0253]|uniref:arsenate-mycothiol transferase ArsC n=1 Tax=Citricoccus sp. SGAir0253 TaxID=2567881 RepID=UPI0010CD004A|nr:low molecular weight phosphatase family protein [Citricoccus sp. SGAir0253]QCU79072.1 low molecular weight phosphatase family protein [Citricoccus sp. SGAir0253]
MTENAHRPVTAPEPVLAGEHRERDLHVLDRLASHLHERYAEAVDRPTVERVVAECYEELDRTATVKTFLATSAARFAESRVRALAIARGAVESPLPRVLFVDDLNAGRSQMAAALVLRHSGGLVTARSAGLEPAGHVHEDALAAMEEVGVPLHHAFPKPLTPDVHAAAQVVITFDCADRVPRLDGKDYRDWAIPNLVGRPLEDIRRAREEIDARVRELVRELGPDTGRPDGSAPSSSSVPRAA